MKILVTGATGFLGRFLCKELRNKGHIVTEAYSKNCDLTKEASLLQFTDTFDRIYHLAAWTQAGDFCLHHPAEQWVINQQINTHVLKWWQAYQPQAKLIAIGTSCGYDPTLPLKEDNYLLGQPIDSLFTYGMTKRMLYVGLKALHQQYGLRYLYLVPSTLYGPEYHVDGRQPHFIFDLIRKILRGAQREEPVVLWGDGEQRRELVHVSDFVHMMLSLEGECGIFNIGAGKEYSIKQFAQLICQTVGYPFENILFDTSKYVGARSKMLCIEKLQRSTTWQPIPLEKGLSDTIAWFSQIRGSS